MTYIGRPSVANGACGKLMVRKLPEGLLFAGATGGRGVEMHIQEGDAAATQRHGRQEQARGQSRTAESNRRARERRESLNMWVLRGVVACVFTHWFKLVVAAMIVLRRAVAYTKVTSAKGHFSAYPIILWLGRTVEASISNNNDSNNDNNNRTNRYYVY